MTSNCGVPSRAGGVLAGRARPPRTFKTWLSRSRGLVGLAVLMPFAVLVLFSPSDYAQRSFGHFSLDAVGWIVFFAGATLRIWATLYIGGRKGQALVTEGPYSICRNPLYAGTFLISLSVAIFLESLAFGIGLVAAAVAYLSVTVPNEEGRLRSSLGAVYGDYCRRVPRFLPDFRKYHAASAIHVDVRCLVLEFRRALRWTCVPLGCELVGLLRAQSWWPHWHHFP